jgi:hypothetical protein
MRALRFLVLGCALLAVLTSAPGWASRSGSSSSHSHSSGGTTHVRGYVRKDGTYVRPHERRNPGSSVPRTPSSSVTPRGGVSRSRVHSSFDDLWSYGRSRPQLERDPGSFYGLQRDENGRIVRSQAAKDAFKRAHPCPSTGRTTGPCPGYVIDHIQALKHGGADDPSNMQWQTKEAAKEKDRWE